ncbi:MAG: NDP-sugar synthase [Desulfurococcaceae archaeon]
MLAGGLGQRLSPLTKVLPKPMVPMAGRPLIEYVIGPLLRQGFGRVIVAAKYIGQVIARHFEGREGVEVRILDSRDTADAVRLLLDELGGEALVTMGDVLTNADYAEIVGFHHRVGADATIALKSVDNPLQYGLVLVDRGNRITLFTEKPAGIELYLLSLAYHRAMGFSLHSNLINMGIYVLSRDALELLRSEPDLMDFGRHVFPFMVEHGYRLYGWIAPPETYWEDVGRLASYKRALWDLLAGEVPGLRPSGEPVGPNAYVERDAEVLGSLVPPVYVGRGCLVERGAVVGPFASLEGDCHVGEGSRVQYSSVWWGARVEGHSFVHDSVIMDGARIKGSRVLSSVVGSGRVVAEDLKEEVVEPVAA